jgi:hypothetical protein
MRKSMARGCVGGQRTATRLKPHFNNYIIPTNQNRTKTRTQHKKGNQQVIN